MTDQWAMDHSVLTTMLASLRDKKSGWIEITEVNGPLEFKEPRSGWIYRLTTEGKMVHVRTTEV